MQKLIFVLNILAILGFPTVFAIVLSILKKIKILMKAQQEQMRGQLLKDFYFYKERGFIYEHEAVDWELQYMAYHSLGANGIMDKRREALMSMDTKKDVE